MGQGLGRKGRRQLIPIKKSAAKEVFRLEIQTVTQTSNKNQLNQKIIKLIIETLIFFTQFLKIANLFILSPPPSKWNYEFAPEFKKFTTLPSP